MKGLHIVQDMERLLRKTADKLQSGQDASSFVIDLATKVKKMRDHLEYEKLAQEIASFSELGFKTLREFESDPLFEGEDAEANTKKLRGAIASAKRKDREMRQRNTKNKRFRQDKGAGSSQQFQQYPQQNQQAPAPEVRKCYRCQKHGHIAKDCQQPDTRNNK